MKAGAQRRDRKATTTAGTSAYLDWVFKSRPLLKAAYQQAMSRFKDLPGVCGIGIGRRFHETDGCYAPARTPNIDYCIKVFVRRKLKKIKPKEKLPRWIAIRPRGSRRSARVGLDVVSVLSGGKGKPGRLTADSRGGPTAGMIDVGHLFACTTQTVPDPLPPGFSPEDANLGTVGAVVRSADGAVVHAVSASHVFIELCQGEVNAPNDKRAVSVAKSQWELLTAGSFRPLTVAMDSCLRDALAFRIPPNIRPSLPHWPDGFTGELATQEDIERAILADSASGFVWVERRGLARPRMIPVDLEAMADPLVLPVHCQGGDKDLAFIQTWRFRFMTGPGRPADEQNTLPGDSGSGVFLWSENNSDCRLLGFHFYETDDQTQSYAADADWFLKQAFGEGFGRDYFLQV